jgi:hypothetical protein
MSSFIEGSQALGNAVQDVTVSFPDATFSAIPDLVVPVVENTVDSSVEQIWAFPVAKTQTGFTIHLSAPTNSANYVLRYFAGSNGEIFQAIARTGKKLSEYSALMVGLLDDDYFMLVHTADSVLQTVRVPLSVLKGMFVSRATSIPGTPAASGVAGQMVVSAKFIYTYDGTLWGQTARSTSSWASDP